MFKKSLEIVTKSEYNSSFINMTFKAITNKIIIIAIQALKSLDNSSFQFEIT